MGVDYINSLMVLLNTDKDALLIGLLKEKIKDFKQQELSVHSVNDKELHLAKCYTAQTLRDFLYESYEDKFGDWHPRTIDIDELIYNNESLNELYKCKALIVKLRKKLKTLKQRNYETS